MTKNFKQNLVDFRGNKLIDKNDKGEDVPISLDIIAVNCLLMNDESDSRLSGVDKLKRFNLAQKIYASSEAVEITPEELTLVKDLIGKFAPTIVMGSAWTLLDKE